MGSDTIDVAVVGGGPAGCAAALTLRRNSPALSVVLIEAGEYAEHRAGEILPPAARTVLKSLDVLHLLDEKCARPSRGVAFAWGSVRLEEDDYFFSARGGGWHLDRNRFDAMMADACLRRGVLVLRGTALYAAERRPSGWELVAGNKRLAARFVVDATGRTAVFARMQGERMVFDDRLTSYSRIFATVDPCSTEILIESAEQGWWYTAPIPGGRRVASFVTDADLGRELCLPANDAWSRLARQTTHVAAAIGCSTAVSDCIVRPASSARLTSTSGKGWVAAGDASAAYDPLAGQGITKALRNGVLAGYTAGDALSGGERVAAHRYSAILQFQFDRYRRMHREYFARETRWRDTPFWARRQAAAEDLVAGAPL